MSTTTTALPATDRTVTARDIGLAVARVPLVLGFGFHGINKLSDPAAAAGVFDMAGFGANESLAVFTGLVELAVAVLFAVGALTTVAAAGAIGVMVAAILTVHADVGFAFDAGAQPGAATPVPGFAYPLTLALIALALAATGPGRAALDAGPLSRLPALLRGGTVPALLVALVVGVVAGIIPAVTA